ncbi:lipocalin family protein [Methylomagnum sp.]
MKIISAIMVILLVAGLSFVLIGHTGIPEGVTPVKGFDINRYLGTWHEIARLDHGFERGLTHVSAEYRMDKDGQIRVINRGFNLKRGQWEATDAKAYFIDSPDVGRLKVSFFGPFYGSYNIIELDEKNYSWALVTGPSRNFLWILSRDKTLDPAAMTHLIEKAKSLGFKLEKIIYVDQKEGTAAPQPAPAK